MLKCLVVWYANIWVFPKMVVPNNHGFSYSKWLTMGCFGGTTILGNPHIRYTMVQPLGFPVPWHVDMSRAWVERIASANPPAGFAPQRWWRKNDAKQLMAEILHQLRLVVYPVIYRVLYIPGGAGFQPSRVVNPEILQYLKVLEKDVGPV